MARPRMKLGEWGNVSVTGQVVGEDGKFRKATDGTRRVDRWRARAKVRDLDGKIRDVEKYGTTKAAARRILLDALRERVTPAAGDAGITGSTLLKDAAQTWRAEVEDSDRLSPNTRRVYLSVLCNHVVGTEAKPGLLAHLTVREIKVAGIERMLKTISREHGPAAAKMTRSVLRGVLDLAVKHDAIPLNPVRATDGVPSRVDRKDTLRDTARAFTRAERDGVVRFTNEDAKARARDLGDLVAFLAGTGARLGEACALRWSALDLDQGAADLGPTVVRITGQGLVIQEQGKTKTSARTVRLPAWLVARLMERKVAAGTNPWDVVFPSPLGRLRDPSNTGHHIRALLDAAGYPWATAHTFRKTVATLLDQAGVSAREAANQLGHAKPSMTTDVYMSRRTVTEQAATVL